MATPVQPQESTSIHPDTVVGPVALTVSDVARSQQFYERAIGLRASDRADGTVALSGDDGLALVELRGNSSAPVLDRRAAGLFHLAILLPTRLDLAFALARLAEARWPLDGASDHLVSEALYLSDPDGNGIEIYRDRPRDEWRRSDGQLEMATLPLDIDSVLGELSQSDRARSGPRPRGTTIGHVHLQVADIAEAEAFYHGVLGFDVMVRDLPWRAVRLGRRLSPPHRAEHLAQQGRPRPRHRARSGLRHFDVRLPGQDALDEVLARVQAAGIPVQPRDGCALVRDPSGNVVALSTR